MTEHVTILDEDEANAVYENASQRYMHMSGDEFYRRYHAGEFDDRLCEPDVIRVTMLLPMRKEAPND